MKQEKPDFFSSLADQQAPEYFWIGCSDSRVPVRLPVHNLGVAFTCTHPCTYSKGGHVSTPPNTRQAFLRRLEMEQHLLDFAALHRTEHCNELSLPGVLPLQANQILGLRPGEVFVQRNVGNLATHKDMNCMTCLEYAVNALKVKSIIICGHYNCGAVKASITLSGKTQGLANLWVSDIKDTRNKHAAELGKLSPDEQVTRYLIAHPCGSNHFPAKHRSVMSFLSSQALLWSRQT